MPIGLQPVPQLGQQLREEDLLRVVEQVAALAPVPAKRTGHRQQGGRSMRHEAARRKAPQATMTQLEPKWPRMMMMMAMMLV